MTDVDARPIAAGTCPNGHQVDHAAKFCAECGAAIPMPPTPDGIDPAATMSADESHLTLETREAPDETVDLPYADEGRPAGSRLRRMRKWLVIGAGAAAAIGLVAGGALVLTRPSASDRYLSALKAQGLLGQFPASRAALVEGHKVCTGIDNGGKDQGDAAGKVAVRYFCPTYLASYKILRTASVTGTFTISNGTYDPFNEFETPNFESAGGGCEGSGGYVDLNASTQVVVTDNHGMELARTSLGFGDVRGDSCVFTYNFNITEGADQYIVTVGRRGSTNYSYDEISTPGRLALIIGTR